MGTLKGGPLISRRFYFPLQYAGQILIKKFLKSGQVTVLIVKNSHSLAGIYFIYLKERSRPNSKVLQYQIWT